MSGITLNTIFYLAAVIGMEWVAWFTHKYVMHGFLWCLHESHHLPREGMFEKNDIFALIFAIPSIVLIYIGSLGTNWSSPEWFWAGLGVATYGLIYFLYHDVLVHRRIDHNYLPKNRYLRKIIHAHRLHHVVLTKEDGISFGFLVTDDPLTIREQMKVLGHQIQPSVNQKAV